MSRSAHVMARFRRPRANRRTTIAVIGDPHIPIGSVDSLKATEPARFLRRAIADINARSPDGTLFVGDLSMDGVPAEFDRFDTVIEDLQNPWTAIPGNHDAPKDFDEHESLPADTFIDRYTPGSLPYKVPIGELDIVALDSAYPSAVSDTANGTVDTEQIAWLDDVLDDALNPIVTVHHPFPSILAQFDAYRQAVNPDLSSPTGLREAEPLLETLHDHGVPMVITGHLHIPTIGTEDGVHEVNVPATSTFPPAYILLEIDQDGTVVRYVPLGDSADTREAFINRTSHRPKAKALSRMAAARVASFPLADERSPSP